MQHNKKGLIIGVANEKSIAWGCAKALHGKGAQIALTYANDKSRPFVEPLSKIVASPIFMPLDVQNEEQAQALFDKIEHEWGRLDFLIHSIAFAPKDDLHGRVIDSSLDGFMTAMDISCHSLIRLVKRAEPLMQEGGAILTMSFYGSQKAVQNYGIMGPVKAALESSVRYIATELGSKRIRINALSPGPVHTRAASGLVDFEKLIEKSVQEAPLNQFLSIEQIGETAAFLVSDNALAITGQVIYVDNGYSIKG